MINSIINLTPKEAYELCKKNAIIIDIRDNYLNAYKTFKVSKCFNITINELNQDLLSLNKCDTFIIADSSGLNSRQACLILIEKGFQNVYNLAGGFVEWEKDGLPIEHDVTERLSGECACMLKPRQKSAGKKI